MIPLYIVRVYHAQKSDILDLVFDGDNYEQITGAVDIQYKYLNHAKNCARELSKKIANEIKVFSIISTRVTNYISQYTIDKEYKY